LNTASPTTCPLELPVSRPRSAAPRWSSAIEQRYGLELCDQWADWFDHFASDSVCDGEFCEPVHPEVLLDETPEVIWPGLMPPDFLPLIGNMMGDWLCARIGPDNRIAEVVHWYHGGGDWLPYGKTIAEAIVYDALASRFPGRQLGLAIPAQSPKAFDNSFAPLSDSDFDPVLGQISDRTHRNRPSIRWALNHLPAAVATVFEADFQPAATGDLLLRNGVAEIAVRCDLALAALDNEIRRRMNPQLAAMLEARWDQDIVRWMFDPSTMPERIVQRLVDHWQLPLADWKIQDWETAAGHCRQIASVRSDLAWAEDVLGWAAQRTGDAASAIEHYARAAGASLFSDQSVRFRTHFDNDRVCKFSVARLMELGAQNRLDPAYVSKLVVETSPQDLDMIGWRDRVCQHWLGVADATASGLDRESAARRYGLIYRAGWDVGCDSIPRYQSLLEELADAAERAGQTAQAKLAITHRDCLRGRYLLG
jgi:tetratricopeptide (TPR) repeat protein